MIPPLKEVRLRSINRWLKTRPSEGQPLSQSPEEIDSRMVAEYESEEDALMQRMMRDKTWGTPEGTRTFNTQKLETWDAVVSQHLPTSAQSPEA